jgi:sec-independent protein translocase protein TatA
MFGNLFTGWHMILILAIVLLVFGAAKLPQLAKGVGQSIRIFRSEVKLMGDDDGPSLTESSAASEPTHKP